MIVKRYDPSLGEGLTESRSGAYVLHSDFQSLAAENERLREALLIIRDGMVDRRRPIDVVDYINQALSRKAAP